SARLGRLPSPHVAVPAAIPDNGRVRPASRFGRAKPHAAAGGSMNAEWRARYEVAVEAAWQAGRLALGYYDRRLAVEWKHDHSPVTVADREAEALLRTTLLGRFPDDGFLGEEHGEQPESSGFRWIIDPIDGTRSFVRGIPIWATLVGLEFRGEQIAGV